jgi:phospholipid-binding lipoprotein MlaA
MDGLGYVSELTVRRDRVCRMLLGSVGRALLIGVVGMALGGCATPEFSMRSLPPETPAAENASAIRNAEAFEAAAKQAAAPAAEVPSQAVAGPGQSAAAAAEGAAAAAKGTAAAWAARANKQDDAEPLVPLTPADAPSMYTYDPWERLNRFNYRFNARFDEAVFLPVSNGYRRVPGPIRAGVHNFFANLSEVDSTANYILQARFLGGLKSVGRFVINSTMGIGGLFDVATKLELPNPPTGFSETLSTWGVHPGPYLVVPILGPSTLRDGVGYLGDYGLNYGVNLFDLYRGYQSYGLGTVNAVDTRSNIGFRYYATGSPFEYEVIRFLYVRKRLIEDEALHGRGKPKPRDVDAPAGR